MIDPMEETTRRADLEKCRIIDVKFASYCAMVYGVAPDKLPQTQLREVRNAFFAGMVLYQGDVLFSGAGDPDLEEERDEKISRYTQRIADELEAYAEGELARLMPTEGTA